jgi:D-amino-acid dehydrogenase
MTTPRSETRYGDSRLSNVHIAVVGAGIVGLAVAYHLIKDGAQVTVIDRDPEGDKASFGNAGGIAVTEVVPASAPGTLWRVFGWIADPLGPLAVRPTHAPKLIPWLVRFAKAGTPREVDRISLALAAINARVYDDLLPMLERTGLTGELHRKGALTVYETEEGYRRDAAEWACKRSRGIVVQEISGTEARQMEPALGPRVQRAVSTPQWSHVSDPKRLVQGVRDWLLNRGVVISKGEVRNIVPSSTSSLSLELERGHRIAADKAVVAAGAWSAILARRLGDPVLLESERGYNMTLPEPGIAVERELIFAERKFVATPLSCGLRIGGAAEFGGLNAAPNFKRSRTLVDLARLYLPELRTEGGTNWAGHRPTTPDSLPVIGPSKHHANVFYAFGHGHLGLTQAATTGRLVSELAFQKPSSIDMTPYGIGRFTSHAGEARNVSAHFLLR